MITQVTEDGSSTDDHANTSPLRKLAQKPIEGRKEN